MNKTITIILHSLRRTPLFKKNRLTPSLALYCDNDANQIFSFSTIFKLISHSFLKKQEPKVMKIKFENQNKGTKTPGTKI